MYGFRVLKTPGLGAELQLRPQTFHLLSECRHFALGCRRDASLFFQLRLCRRQLSGEAITGHLTSRVICRTDPLRADHAATLLAHRALDNAGRVPVMSTALCSTDGVTTGQLQVPGVLILGTYRMGGKDLRQPLDLPRAERRWGAAISAMQSPVATQAPPV
jgi:hypothetical protein